jgi:large subunit ribosomal protein L19
MSIEPVMEVKLNPNIPVLSPGDTVKVSTKIVEGEKERIQVFQGVVIRLRKGGSGASFTVRRVAYGVGVERTFPIYSPLVEKVELVRHGKVRRAKLYYLRQLSGKASRIKEKRVEKAEVEFEEAEQPETPAEMPAAEVKEQPAAEKVAPSAEKAEQPEASATAAEKAITPKAEAPAAEAPETKTESKTEPATEAKKE